MIYQLDNTALMYVASAFTDGTAEKKTLGSEKGSLLLTRVGEEPSSDASAGTRLAFQYRGPKDTILRSVIFNSDVVKYAKLTKAADMRIPLKAVTLTVKAADPVIINNNYMVRISVPQAFSLNPNELFIRDAVYHAKSGDTMGQVLAGIAYNLVKSQNDFTMWKVIVDGNDLAEETSFKNAKSLYEYVKDNSLESITIKAVWNADTEWQLKYKEVQAPVFYVSACILGEEIGQDIEEGHSGWITVAKVADDTTTAGSYIPNGYETANREMWYLVSNGTANDQDSRLMYRTETVADPTKEYNYINIHVSENSESGIASGMNEKDIIIASASSLDAVKTALEKFGIKFKA